MAPEVTPDGLRQAEFRTAFRGYDPTEVEALLAAAATQLDRLDAERRKLATQLQEAPGRDLETEFESVGREVAAILQAAREAADAMRERASLDAAKWRSEAMEEAETARKEAAADAEALRRDAWVTGSELLDQSATKAEAMRAGAERDVLTVMGEAEREAHRLTSGARRDAEDLVRSSTMESEKIIADAVARRDEIIDGANRQAATAQERARALEQRRDELLVELENVRSTLTRLEGSLEERREALDLTASEPSSVKVVHPPADAAKQWDLGETVRVVYQDGRHEVDEETTGEEARAGGDLGVIEPPPPTPSDPRTPASSEHTRADQTPVVEAEAEAETEAETEAEADVDVDPRPVPTEPEPEPATSGAGDLDALFASLRDLDEGASLAPQEEKADPVRSAPSAPEGVDWIEVREDRLLPITNRALRGVKKAVTEVQNVALDSLRTDTEWQPDDQAIAHAVHAELVAVWSESFAAGHSVAEQMAGAKLKRPATPASKADREFATDLAGAVSAALHRAGEGPRERQSAASRVFRVWRSDEAERRIRDIALRGYESGLEKSSKVGSNS